MRLSERLETIAGLVTPGLTLADIGTDHAYIPIRLAEAGVIPKAIAADINGGPLERAREHIRAHHLEEKIEPRLSDGLDALSPGEAQCILIAGMGGALTVRILQKGLKTGRLSGCAELILQPQSEIRDVRVWLEDSGWAIVREEMVFEDGKYYTMIKAKQQQAKRMTEAGLMFGPDLIERGHPVLRQYLLREERLRLEILESLKNGSGDAAKARKQEICAELKLLRETLKYGNFQECPEIQ